MVLSSHWHMGDTVKEGREGGKEESKIVLDFFIGVMIEVTVCVVVHIQVSWGLYLMFCFLTSVQHCFFSLSVLA